MALKRSDYAKGSLVAPNPGFSGVAVTHRFTMLIPANAQVGDIFEVAAIPPGCRPLDIVIDADDLDTHGTPTIAFNVGVMSGNYGADDDTRTCGAEFFAASQVARTGGVAQPSLASAYRVPVNAKARGIGIEITTAAATGAAGTVGLTVTYAAE